MLERIQKIISAAGVTSRRAAEELIAEGRVRVNGQVVTEPGTKADASRDHIKVDGKLINPHQPKTYIMLNKPAGFVTTLSDPEGRPTVQDLLKGVKVRVYPVGRLDYNTEGMLILTNDGDFAHLVTHPRHELPKTYLAKLKGVLDENQIASIEAGLFLDDGKTAPAKLRKIRKEEANSWVEITITEGRKRQVRRMFDRVGRSVIKLKRTRTGSLVLGDLPEGTFRYLTPIEVKGLMDLSQKTEVKQKEVPGSGVKGRGAASGYARSATGARSQKPGVGRVRIPAMQDTSDGRRKNQVIKPRPDSGPAGSSVRTTRPGVVRKREDSERSTAPGAAVRNTASAATGNRETRRVPAQRSYAGTKSSEARSRGSAFETRKDGRRPASGPRRDSTYSPKSHPASSRPSTAAGVGRPASGASMRKPEVRRKPDQRPWPSTRKSTPGSKGPGVVPGYGERSVSSARPATRSAMGRPAAGAGVGRSVQGALPGRPATKRKPAPRSLPGSKNNDSRRRGAGYEGRSEWKRPSSGPRPNKSTHTGGKGPRRVNRPAGSRGPGQGAGRRGPRR